MKNEHEALTCLAMLVALKRVHDFIEEHPLTKESTKEERNEWGERKRWYMDEKPKAWARAFAIVDKMELIKVPGASLTPPKKEEA